MLLFVCLPVLPLYSHFEIVSDVRRCWQCAKLLYVGENQITCEIKYRRPRQRKITHGPHDLLFVLILLLFISPHSCQ